MPEKLKITVLKRQDPKDIFDEYPVAERDWFVPCSVYEDGQEFILDGMKMPEGFCGSAWQTIYPNVRTLGFGGNLPYFEEEGVSVTCCADGMRPVIFKIERI
ncbi:MAG: TIGR04076 family protein, partial [Anaerolineae bacterium]|nr:TIGR04076 family protein [Anaerolineae bacterium]NIQ81755.1 TIGR04076 family protein [Anaerolineae bacterium]